MVGSFRQDVITEVSAERTVNMYETRSLHGKSEKYLHPTPGKLFIDTFSEGNTGRASFTFRDFVYFVVGDSIYRMDNTFVPNVIAPNFFTTLVGHIGIAANEFQIIFVDGDKAYLWDTTAASGSDITASFPAGFMPLDVIYMDGSFLAIGQGTGFRNRFYVSALNDGTTWPILDFALINSRPTILNGIGLLKRKIFFFGQDKTEVWYDAGDADFRFRRENNLLFEHGVKAIDTISEGFDMLFYLSADADGVGSIMMVQSGITPTPISTREMDEQIQNFTDPANATGFVYKINGMVFYQISFTHPDDDSTFVFNATQSTADDLQWHELETLSEDRDIAQSHSFFENKHFITSYADDKLYEVSHRYLSNAGEKIKKTRILRPFSSPTYERVKYHRVQIDMLKGVGLINTKPLSSYQPHEPFPLAATDVDPKVFFSISEDGGITYQTFGQESFGKAGDRLIRIIWRTEGSHRDAIFKFEIFNDVPVYILSGAMDVTQEPQ
jgi:hypothetical protein